MTRTLSMCVLAAALAVASGGPATAAAMVDAPEEDGLGPCQDAPFARLADHPRLREHEVDGVRTLVLLPAAYDSAGRYPVLYLLHGGVSVPDEWVTRMDIERLTLGRDLIVVMPDGGRGGFYRDWANGGRRWETFHTQRLVPWVDATYPTLADRTHRAVAGLSMGGGGALYYAARHPDVFGAAASFSGAPLAYVNAADHTLFASVVYDIQQRCEEDQTGVEPFGVYGNPITDEIAVRDNMPEDLAPGLSNTLVYLSAGDGVPVDEEQQQLVAERPETVVFEQLLRNQANILSTHLDELGIAHEYDRLPGSHWWATFRPGLVRYMDLLFAGGLGGRLPSAFDYRTARDQFDVWGWDVTLTGRPQRAFTTLGRASSAGFWIEGSGTAEVLTAPLYRPRERLVTVIDGTAIATRADRAGRVAVTVPMNGRRVGVSIARR